MKKKYVRISGMIVFVNPMYTGEPYILHTSSGYHVAQGCIGISDIRKFYETIEEAVTSWNMRTTALTKGIKGE